MFFFQSLMALEIQQTSYKNRRFLASKTYTICLYELTNHNHPKYYDL